MLRRIIQLLFLLIGGMLGIVFIPKILTIFHIDSMPLIEQAYVKALLGAIIIFIFTFWLVDYVVAFVKKIEEALLKIPIIDLLFGSLGLIIGLLLAYLIWIPFGAIDLNVITIFIPISLTTLFGYLGFKVGFTKRDELISVFNRNKKKNEEAPEVKDNMSKLKILDTSVIIDGRIADIIQTGFIEGKLIIPQFVLAELQYIADSSDTLKRNRGRRGLDVLKKIQKELPIEVEIFEGDFEDIQEVDSKLVKLAKVREATIITNDFNLNKVCEVQNVEVLNINDLSNAIKPVVLPGEEMGVFVVKDGKEQKQGVAYLDDGTMIVVEDGKECIGKEVMVVVTSVLQTSAGRMIFAKLKTDKAG
ncbi:MAG: PIN/TRAM domain-containing protein [Bacillaceae bacterium]